MIHAEAYWLWNAAMCACALPLGGKMAGLPSPGMKTLLWAAGADGLLATASLCCTALSPVALLGLPGAVALCFRAHGWQACVRCTLTTLFAAMLFAGALTLWLGTGLSPAAAGALTLASGFLCGLMMKLIPNVLTQVRQVELRVADRAILLPAMLDSGNLLRDPVTGLPVLIIPARAARTLFPALGDPGKLTDLPLGFRLLSVRTAAGSALLPMFRPDECRIYVNGSVCHSKLLAAVAGREYGGAQALVPAAALPTGRMDSIIEGGLL